MVKRNFTVSCKESCKISIFFWDYKKYFLILLYAFFFSFLEICVSVQIIVTVIPFATTILKITRDLRHRSVKLENGTRANRRESHKLKRNKEQNRLSNYQRPSREREKIGPGNRGEKKEKRKMVKQGADRCPWTIIAREVARIGLIVGKVGSRAVKGASPEGEGGEGAKIGSGESVRAAENTFRDADYSYARLLINPAYRVFGHELVCWLASCLSFDLTKVITNEFDIGAPGLGINVRPAGGSRFNRYTAEHRSTKRADSTMDIERAYCLVSRVFFPPIWEISVFVTRVLEYNSLQKQEKVDRLWGKSVFEEIREKSGVGKWPRTIVPYFMIIFDIT